MDDWARQSDEAIKFHNGRHEVQMNAWAAPAGWRGSSPRPEPCPLLRTPNKNCPHNAHYVTVQIADIALSPCALGLAPILPLLMKFWCRPCMNVWSADGTSERASVRSSRRAACVFGMRNNPLSARCGFTCSSTEFDVERRFRCRRNLPGTCRTTAREDGRVGAGQRQPANDEKMDATRRTRPHVY